MATRRERVILDLEDSTFTSGLARAAVASGVLDKALNKLGNEAGRAGDGLDSTGTSGTKAGRKLGDASRDIDKFSGRLRLMLDTAVLLGPALAPLGAGLVPAVAGLGAQLGVAALAGGTAALALNGVGEALDVLNKYQLDPSAENLAELNRQMELLGPSGSRFVTFLDSLGPALSSLQQAARDGLLPGLEEGITALVDDVPALRTFVGELAEVMGDLAAGTGEALAGERFREFFEYVRTDAAPTLESLGRTIGFFAEGFANLVVGLAPATRDFTGGLESMAQSFAQWSRELDNNESFEEFLAFVRESGPQTAEFAAEFIKAGAAIVQAMAPIGAVTLPLLTRLLEVISAFASTPLGTVFLGAVVGLTAYNRAIALGTGLSNKFTGALDGVDASGTRASTGFSKAAKGLGLLTAGLIAYQEVDKQLGLSVAPEEIQRMIEVLDARAGDGLEAQIRAVTAAIEEQKAIVDDAAVEGVGAFGIRLFSNDEASEAQDRIDGLSAHLAELKHQLELIAIEEDKATSDALLSQLFTGIAPAADAAADATDGYAGASQDAADASRAETSALNQAAQAMREKANETRSAFDAETRWGQAVNEARAAVESGRKGINRFTEDGQANRAVLSSLSDAWAAQSTAVKNNQDRYAAARRTFLDTAEAMGVPKKAAKELADQLLEVPRSTVANVTLRGAAEGVTVLNNLRNALGQLRDKTIHVNVIRNNPNGTTTSVVEPHAQITERTGRPRIAPRSTVGPFGRIDGLGTDDTVTAFNYSDGKGSQFGQFATAAAQSALKLDRALDRAAAPITRERRNRDAITEAVAA